MATNASRFINFRLTSRNAFYNRDGENRQTRRTLLVPEVQRNEDDLFRATFMTNFTKTGMMTVRSNDNEGGNELNVPREDPALASNGFSVAGQGNPPVIGRYKIIKDGQTIGDQRLFEQESRTIKNIHNLVFFVIIVVVL